MGNVPFVPDTNPRKGHVHRKSRRNEDPEAQKIIKMKIMNVSSFQRNSS